VGVLETRQNVALVREALLEVGAPPGQQRQLQRHVPLERTVRSASQPNLRHSSRAQKANELVGPYEVAGAEAARAALIGVII
jgi:hypothetical protein